MNRSCFIIWITGILATCAFAANAQVYNAGAVYIPAGGEVGTWGNLTNTATGAITNAGNLYAHDSINNNGATGYDGGTLFLIGMLPQALGGNAIYNTTNLIFSNSAGFLLSKRYSVGNEVVFASGIVNAPDSTEPLEFNPGGTGGTAVAATSVSDAGHVNGYTLQKGTGNFVYPVGDSVKYEPIAANLSNNSDGVRCNYTPADAGSAPYLTTGLSATPLLHYNALEYWDLHPSGSATGSVTVYYDNYNNIGIGPDFNTALTVAHKVAAGWNNEGGIVSGTQAAGTVTSIGEISSWSPFTLGSTTHLSPLPVKLVSFTAVGNNCDELLFWNTESENGLAAFDVQYSTDGVGFMLIGTVKARGNNSQYNFTYKPEKGRGYYRLRMREDDGSYTYSNVLTTEMNCNNHSVAVYPNPVSTGEELHITLAGYNGSVKGIIYDIAGRLISSTDLINGQNVINTDILAAGNYQLCIFNAENGREVYKIMVIQY